MLGSTSLAIGETALDPIHPNLCSDVGEEISKWGGFYARLSKCNFDRFNDLMNMV